MTRILFIALLASMSLPAAAQSSAAGVQPDATAPGTPEAAQRPLPPHRVVRQGVDRLTGYLIGAGGSSTEALQVFLDETIAPHFDFAYMTRWAAGPLYRRLSKEQRAQMQTRLESSFMGALARNLGSFSEPLPKIDVFRARPGKRRGDARVPVRVVTDQGQIMRLEFRFYWSSEGWKIYDVTANGASAVAYYREFFGELLRRQGPEALARG